MFRSDPIRFDLIRSDMIRSDPIRSDRNTPKVARFGPTQNVKKKVRSDPIRSDPIVVSPKKNSIRSDRLLYDQNPQSDLIRFEIFGSDRKALLIRM